MEVLIKTILETENESYVRYIEELLSEEFENIISESERDMLEYLKKKFDNTGKFPSEDYFIEEFPEYEVPLERLDEGLSMHDLDMHYRELVNERTKKQIQREAMREVSKVSDEGFTDEINQKLRDLYKISRDSANDWEIFKFGDIRKIYEQKKEKPIGLQTFVKEIDENIGGFNWGTVNVIFGFTASGKTQFVTNIGYKNAYDLGYNVAFVSLEVQKDDIIYNILSRHSFENQFDRYPYIGHEDIRKMRLDEEKEEYVMGEILGDWEEKRNGELIILDETDFSAFTFSDIRNRLEIIDDQLEGGLDAVIWDHANLFKFSNKNTSYMSQYDIINEWVSFIRELSIKWRKKEDEEGYRKLCNIIVAQSNRNGWRKANKNDGRYNLTAISGANELERSAYRVISLYSNDKLKQSQELKMQLLKNRSGPTIYEPITVFWNPEAVVVGDELEGFNDSIDLGEEGFDEAFGGGLDF